MVSLPGLRSASCIAFHVCGGSWRVSPTKMLFCARSISISASGGVALPASSKIATGKRISLTSGWPEMPEQVPAITRACANRSAEVSCGPIEAR